MHTLATAAQLKELDRAAIEKRGIPSLDLMEAAASAVAEKANELLQRQGRYAPTRVSSLVVMNKYGLDPTPEEQAEIDKMRDLVENQKDTRIAVFCGPGNNGGDGIAAARLLMDMGYSVRTFLIGDRAKMTHDARDMEEKLLAAGGKLEEYAIDDQMTNVWLSTCDVMIDALFGVGLCREVQGDFHNAILRMNQCRAHVISCDIPSGVHADTGEILGIAVQAKHTVTFSCPKPGLYLGEGSACAGEIEIADIGIPSDLIFKMIERQPERTEAIPPYATLNLPRRRATAHKGDFGKVFILAGSVGYTGAPVFAASAAVRTGAGLVYLGVPSSIYPIVAVKCNEAMPFPLPEEYDRILEKARNCDAALIGPGLGRAPETDILVRRLLADLNIPVVLDADGINALQGHINTLDERSALTVLTPHDGEFQRISGCTLPIKERLSAAREFAKAHGCVLVLKGHGTITAAPDGRCRVNTTGNPGMAKGGSGDVLAGMIVSLLGQKQFRGPHEDLAELCAWAVFFHGQAGDRCAERFGQYGMTPGDMLAAIPEVLKEHQEE